MGNGLLLKTPQPYSQYATSEAWAAIFEMNNLLVAGPSLALLNPDVQKVQPTLQGPTLDDIVMGVFTGQITDIKGALADLDARQQAAFDQALADAQAAGAKVTIDDWIMPDWVPTENYVFPGM
jgi:multiple sugar transport system substrate-binding protein